MVTTVLTISFSCVWRPSLVSFSAYIFGSLVGLFETKTTFLPSSRSFSMRRFAPDKRLSPR